MTDRFRRFWHKRRCVLFFGSVGILVACSVAYANPTKDKQMKRLLTLTIFALLLSNSAVAQTNVASQQVSIDVAEIAVMAVHGNISMTINSATAGQNPDPVSAAGSYSITTNKRNRKITAQLDRDMPEGLTLQVRLEHPNSGNLRVSTLSSQSSLLHGGIKPVAKSGLFLDYTVKATVDAKPDTHVRTVTYTVTGS